MSLSEREEKLLRELEEVRKAQRCQDQGDFIAMGVADCRREVTVNDLQIMETKQFRKDLDAVLQRLKDSPKRSDDRKESMKKIVEAIMWLGMDLKGMNTPNPYPDSYDPSNTRVAPTADGLKL